MSAKPRQPDETWDTEFTFSPELFQLTTGLPVDEFKKWREATLCDWRVWNHESYNRADRGIVDGYGRVNTTSLI